MRIFSIKLLTFLMIFSSASSWAQDPESFRYSSDELFVFDLNSILFLPLTKAEITAELKKIEMELQFADIVMSQMKTRGLPAVDLKTPLELRKKILNEEFRIHEATERVQAASTEYLKGLAEHESLGEQGYKDLWIELASKQTQLIEAINKQLPSDYGSLRTLVMYKISALRFNMVPSASYVDIRDPRHNIKIGESYVGYEPGSHPTWQTFFLRKPTDPKSLEEFFQVLRRVRSLPADFGIALNSQRAEFDTQNILRFTWVPFSTTRNAVTQNDVNLLHKLFMEFSGNFKEITDILAKLENYGALGARKSSLDIATESLYDLVDAHLKQRQALETKLNRQEQLDALHKTYGPSRRLPQFVAPATMLGKSCQSLFLGIK